MAGATQQTSAPKIFAAMAAIMTEVGAVGKESRNTQQGFSYRGIDSVYNALNSVMAKHKVFTTSEILSKTREERVTEKDNNRKSILAFTCLRIRYTFHAEDGSSVTSDVEGEGMDSGDKSSNKAMAVAHKYALLQAFCVPTQEMDDPDKDSHELSEQQQQQEQQRQQQSAPDQRAAWVAKALESIKKIDTRAALDAWWDSNKTYLDALTKEQYQEVDRAAASRVGALKAPPKGQQQTRPSSPDWAADLDDSIPF